MKFLRKDREYFDNFMEYAERIKEIAERILGEAEVLVFGSVADGRATMASDIDVLIISKNAPKKISEKSKVIGEILKEIGVFSPFEIHLVTPEEFKWYENFLKKFIRIK